MNAQGKLGIITNEVGLVGFSVESSWDYSRAWRVRKGMIAAANGGMQILSYMREQTRADPLVGLSICWYCVP